MLYSSHKRTFVNHVNHEQDTITTNPYCEVVDLFIINNSTRT